LSLEIFAQKNSAADFFRQKINWTGKNRKIASCATFWGLWGNVHGSSMAHWKARGRLPINANWTFLLALTVEALSADIGRNRCVRKGVDHFERQFQEELGSPTNDCCRQKTRIPGLSRGVIGVIVRLAVLTQYRRVTIGQTDGHDDGQYPR